MELPCVPIVKRWRLLKLTLLDLLKLTYNKHKMAATCNVCIH